MPTVPPAEGLLLPSREQLARNQRQRFQELLWKVWTDSAFYRDYYRIHGIREKDLAELTVSDLPLITKPTLMEQFDRAVTDSRLKRAELELWLNRVRDPRQMFRGEFIVMHSSGSSGVTGIFVYSRTDWQVMNSVMANRLPRPENYPQGRTRVGFYRVAHGHFAGIATALQLPAAVYDTLVVSCLDPVERVIEQLQTFRPHRLTGYSSSIASLADHAIDGRLRIQPQRVFVSGDLLTSEMKRKIKQAWDAPIANLYGASESLFLAVQDFHDEAMTVMSDLNLLEILDERNRPVKPGEEGRVVITNLYNYTLPILRYDLGDYVTCGALTDAAAASTIAAIRPGKANDALPVRLDSGARDSISPRALTSFYAPGLERAQFISLPDDRLQIDYVARENIDREIRSEFQRILNLKGASRTSFEVRRVPNIAADAKTGKVRLVVVDRDQPRERFRVVVNDAGSNYSRLQCIPSAPGFRVFDKKEIEQSIGERFERQVQNFPERVSIRTRALTLTYDALNRAANRIAHAILARRTQRSEPIALLLEPGVMAIATILGILKAGKFYVPLDPSYPQPWLAAMLKNAQTTLMVTDHANLPAALTLVHKPHYILDIDDLDSGLADQNPGLSIAPGSLAYLFYTSGSTGQPKGVVQTHRNVLHQIACYTNGLELNSSDRCSLLHSHAFSASRLDIFGALLNGAALLPFSFAKEGKAKMASWLIEEEATVLHWIPSGFRHLVDGLSGGCQFPNVRAVVLGSEPVLARDVYCFQSHFSSGCVLVNRFGTTETGNICWYFMRRDTKLAGGVVPIGHVIEDTEVLLLDENGEKVGYEQAGEITVRSRYLSRGYSPGTDLHGMSYGSALTDTEIRTHRTGDLACMRYDGCMVHLGRKDLQTKIRGHRVEIGQIEDALLEHSTVREAAVVPCDDSTEERRLVAFIVARPSSRLDTASLRSFLEARLPAYMVPASFVQLESLPLTPSGKVNRRALPATDMARIAPEALFAAPQSPIEQAVAEIWTEVLGVSRVGLHDRFLDLGGHSLLASTLVSRIAAEFNVEITLRQFFELATVGGIAEVVRRFSEQPCELPRVAPVLSEVESLSEEQARQILEQNGK